MKSVLSATAASILTAVAFAAWLARPGIEPIALIMPAAFPPSELPAPTREAPKTLSQLSPETGETSDDTADNQNDSGDSAEADSSAQNDDRSNADDAQN